MSAPEMVLDQPRPERDRREVGVRCACVTTWPEEGGDYAVLTNLRDDPEEQAQLRKALDRPAPVAWIELELDCDSDREALEWYEPTMEPWDDAEQPAVRWSDIREELDLLGIEEPAGRLASGVRSRQTNMVALTLDALPLVYPLGIRRTRNELLVTEGVGMPDLFPAVGFQQPKSVGNLRTYMWRMNVAVVGHFVISLRLRDCKWPSSGGTEFPDRADTLVIRERFIPTPKQPTVHELAEAIALFQVETCGAILNRGRDWLSQIEGRHMQSPDRAAARNAASNGGVASGDAEKPPDLLDPKTLDKSFDELFRLGVRAEEMERELARVVERYNLNEKESGPAVAAIRKRYKDKLDDVRSFQAELRQRCDGISSMVSNRQFAVAGEQQNATERFQRRATVVGAAVLIPALVAGIFGANVELPGKDEVRGLVAMIFFMVGLGAGTWWGIDWLDKRGKRTCQNFWTPEFAHTHAGFIVAVVAFGFGVVALTPAMPSNLSGGEAGRGILGVGLLALGLAAAAWCWVNAGRARWWNERVLPPRLTRAGQVLGPALAIGAGVLLVPALF